MLSFKLLGNVVIYQNGQPLTQFRSRKEAALLIYLAQTGQVHPRQYLAELLWSDRPTPQALRNLRTVLTRLRKQVSEALVITRDTVALAPSSYQDVDSVQLLETLAAIDQVDGSGTATRLKQALDKYRGEFLADFLVADAIGFEQWAFTVRQQIHQQVLTAYRKLAQYLLRVQELEQGIEVIRRWLEVDPLDEEAHFLLIQFLFQADRRGAAVAHYNEVVERLQKELGVPPSVQMTALIQRAQHPQPSLEDPLPLQPGHNLPTFHDPFIGRAAEQTAIHRRMDQSWCRLVTLTGPGGVGKTRLALTVAYTRLGRYRDGVWFVPLENIDADDPNVAEAIAVEIATVLGLRLSGPGKPVDQVLQHLRPKQALLILDNFEHLLDGGVTLVIELLRSCPQIQLLITSQEPLGLRAEWLIALQGLDHASALHADASDAVALFQARQAQQQWLQTDEEDLPIIQEICRLVEGLPLAIELAAGLTPDLSPRQILERLQTDFDVLETVFSNTPRRHRSLRIVFEMSWSTLSPGLQQALASLTVFEGGFTPDAGRRVAQIDQTTLDALVAKSLLTYHPTQDRYHLHPVIRAYGAEKLPQNDPVFRRHTAYYLTWLLQFREDLVGEGAAQAIAQIEPEMDNIRLAYRNALRQRSRRLLQAVLPLLAVYYRLRGLPLDGEALMHITRRSAIAWGEDGAALVIQAGLAQARFQLRLGRYWPAIATLKTVLELARQHGDRQAEGMAYIWWGEALWRLGDLKPAQEKLEHAVTIGQDLGDKRMIAWARQQLGVVHDIRGAPDQALVHLAEARILWEDLRNLPALSNTLNSMGLVHLHRGDLPTARRLFEQALDLAVHLADRHLQGLLLHNLGLTASEQGDHRGAQGYLQRALALSRICGNLTAEGETLVDLGRNHLRLGEVEAAVQSLERALQLAHRLQNRGLASSALFSLAQVRRSQPQWDEARRLYEDALSQAHAGGMQGLQCEILLEMAELFQEQDARQAREFATQAYTLASQIARPDFVARASRIARNLAPPKA